MAYYKIQYSFSTTEKRENPSNTRLGTYMPLYSRSPIGGLQQIMKVLNSNFTEDVRTPNVRRRRECSANFP